MDARARIEAAEAALNGSREVLDRFSAALDEFAAAQDQVAAVSNYLGSEEWFEDRDAHDAGGLREVAAGILSEDLGYDLIVDNREIAIRMLETATRILRDL